MYLSEANIRGPQLHEAVSHGEPPPAGSRASWDHRYRKRITPSEQTAKKIGAGNQRNQRPSKSQVTRPCRWVHRISFSPEQMLCKLDRSGDSESEKAHTWHQASVLRKKREAERLPGTTLSVLLTKECHLQDRSATVASFAKQYTSYDFKLRLTLINFNRTYVSLTPKLASILSIKPSFPNHGQQAFEVSHYHIFVAR